MRDMRKRIESLEHQLDIASAEGDYHRVYQLEKRIEHLKGHGDISDQTDPYAPEGNPIGDENWEE